MSRDDLLRKRPPDSPEVLFVHHVGLKPPVDPASRDLAIVDRHRERTRERQRVRVLVHDSLEEGSCE